MSKVRFSGASRAADLLAMASETLDLLVIGGGITGAGIAWDAAMRGLRVALIEQRDFAFGTSSRSTKLIHGGLRYLAQGEVGLVREVGRERAVLHRLAPHLVHPMKLLLPLYKKGPYGRLSTSVGLWMYDRLAGVSHSERRVMLSKKQTLQREPGLRQEGLIGGGMYVEYRTDDSRLTLEVLKTANFAGALLANYAQATRLLYNERGAVCGADVQDLVEGRTLTVKARRVVNATGPWVDQVRRMDGDSSGKRLHLTKGVHVTVKATDLPVKHALYIAADDGRMVFVIPRGTRTYIGTTDTDYDGALEHPTCRAADVDYLLRTVNAHFPGAHLHPEHVTSSWAGLRPLLHEDGKSPSELSRKEEIFCSPSGLYSVAGGKLTGFRTMAEKVVDLVVDDLKTGLDGAPFAACSTGVTPLSGGDVGLRGFEPFYQAMLWVGQEEYGLSRHVLDSLLYRYGSNVRAIFSYLDVDDALREPVGQPMPLLRAELKYSVEHEMTLSLRDFLVRRTGALLFAADEAMQAAPELLTAFAGLLGWDDAEQKRQWQDWEEAVQEARGWREGIRV